ncbi:hypothetical protein RMAECT_0502 [Rickettsia rhipicephali str. Ect]|uniref:Uncharacterized protein n=1 Tax=Rickettsia rhipicephali str. Ect TaxID=1359199 RepID=A0A0F3PFW4_RICRH|nr:hypothetical protein RMAECT_0502 [Rickettsia rhipicephali str. Ect]
MCKIGEIAKDVLSLVKGIINLVANVAEIKILRKQYMNGLKVS